MLKSFILVAVTMIVLSAFAGTAVMGQSGEEGMRLYDDGLALYKEARSKEDLQRAEEKLERALEIFETLKFDKGIGDAANLLGVLYANSGRHNKAQENWGKALEVYERVGDLTGQGRTLNNLGLVYADLGQYAEAVECYEKSLEIKGKLGDMAGEGATLNNLGNVYNIQGQHTKALEHYEKSLGIAGKLGDVAAEAGALNSMGLVHRGWGQYSEAVKYYEKSLEIARRLGDLGAEGRSLNNLGNVYSLLGRYSKAVEYYEKAFEVAGKLGDPAGQGTALNNLGLVYTDLGQFFKAAACYQRSLALKRQLGDLRGEGKVLNNFGLVYADAGQYPKAMDYYEKALEVFRKLGDAGGEGDAAGNLGNLYNAWGRYSEAAACYEHSLEIAGKLGDPAGQGNALNNLGLVYVARGQYLKAVEHYEKALAVKTKLGDVRGQGVTLMNLGRIYAQRGDYDKARAYFEAALVKYKEIGVPLDWPKKLMGDLYLDLGDAGRAEPFLKEAGHNSSMGRLHLFKSDYQGAKDYYERLRQSAEKNRDMEDLFTAYTGLGTAYEGIRDHNRAEEYFLKAVNLTEDLRSSLPKAERETFFDVRTNGFLRTAPYEGLARVRIRMNRPLEAFKDSEYTKSRTFAEAMSRWSPSTGFDIPADTLNKDRELNDELAAHKKKAREAYEKSNQEAISAIEPRVKERERELEVHVKMLREKFPLFAATKYPEPMGLGETALKPNEWVLAYHVTDPGTIVYLTKGKEIIQARFKPIPRQEIENLVLRFRKPLEIVPGEDDFDEKLRSFDLAAGKTLSDLLLSDVLEILPRHVPLIVAPDGILGTLPFEMLALNGQGSIKTDKDLPYISGEEFFGDRNFISYCQSVTALTLSRIHAKGKSAEAGLLAIADPVFQENDERMANAPEKKALTGVPASPYVRQSLMAVEDTGPAGKLEFPRLSLTGGLAKALEEMHAKNSNIYTGFDADKTYFMEKISPSLNRYDKVVFATHGYFGKDLPGIMEPVLVLSLVPSGTDGYLRMTEVMGLDMNADIVALTACQTGLGKRISGEGTMAMGRAFQYAGARSVLMSLWSVSEASSVNLVESFFLNMKEGRTKSEALAAARAEIRKKGFDHPFFWAGFILVGEGM